MTKAEKAEYNRQWRKDNPDQALSNLRHWRANNPDKVREHSWEHIDRRVEHIRERVIKYGKDHPEIMKKAAKKYRENHKDRVFILKESLKLLEEGKIIKTDCSCGEENTRMFHLDYIDPLNVIFLCKECFWARTKERNRAKKLMQIDA